MALIKCPECGKEVSDQAASCPNCGHPLRRKENAQPQMQQNNNQPNVRYVSQPVKKKGHGCLITIIIIVVFFAIVVAIIGGTSGKTGSNDDIDAESIKSVEETAEQTEIPFGQEGSLGNLSMTVNEVAEAESISAADGYMSYKPDSGKYAIINVTIKNNSKNSEQVLINYFKLIGPDEAEYVSTIIPVADDKFLTIDSINPNLDITGNLVFEIPKDLDAKDCVLHYSDYDLFSGSFDFSLQ